MSDPADDQRRLAQAERKLEELLRTRPIDDPQVMLARNQLAVQYRTLYQPDRSTALFANVPICEHLEPVRRYLLEQGAWITYAGTPWSRNCRTWFYVDRIIDPAALIAELNLPPCVTAHVHRGTHDGSEQGLVCSEHHDGVIGPLPDDAPPRA